MRWSLSSLPRPREPTNSRISSLRNCYHEAARAAPRGGKSGGGAKGGGESGGAGGTSRSSSVAGIFVRMTRTTSYGGGGGKVVTIPSGQLFSGRTEGAGRGHKCLVLRSRTYGSGYPGITGRGVVGRGFPFYFWPLSFGAGGGIGTAAYLHSNSEYGHADNSSRPGGPIMTAAFQSNSTSGMTFRILADNSTVTDLIADISANCSSSLSAASATAPSPYNDSAVLPPQPEQVVQYYRASSIALSLDGYNNTAVFAAEGTPDVPLPAGIDTTLLDCLNQTIGLAAPLVDGGGARWGAVPNNAGLLALAWLVWRSAASL
ncbi:hypothetical protein B0H10DRAFT_2167070 [Mycena sp. CBHHK59/15]|nr:hypothetical protein B0H10DRAFT_2167070 [Mycena sp. CBHHK59/15]